jgi:hypothetical protein
MRWYLGGVRIPVHAALLALLLACALPAAAQSPPGAAPDPAAPAHGLGDKTLSLSLGPTFPLFYLSSAGLTGTNLKLLGGTASISWSAYVNGAIQIGAEIGGGFAFSRPNWNSLLMLPILVKGQYVLDLYPFEVPISLGVGMNVVKYGDLKNLDLLIKPGASLMYIYDSKWSFGANLAWWWDMQFYPTDPSQSRIGNFLELSASVLYHYQ